MTPPTSSDTRGQAGWPLPEPAAHLRRWLRRRRFWKPDAPARSQSLRVCRHWPPVAFGVGEVPSMKRLRPIARNAILMAGLASGLGLAQTSPDSSNPSQPSPSTPATPGSPGYQPGAGTSAAPGTGDNSNGYTNPDQGRHNFGWIGLIGLAGLAGLARRDRSVQDARDVRDLRDTRP